MIPTLAPPANETVRVRLTEDQYLGEYGGRLSSGTAVEVPPDVARRWIKLGVAVPGAEGDLTLREQKRAQLAALQAEIDALSESAGTYDQMVTRDGTGGVRPTRRAGATS